AKTAGIAYAPGCRLSFTDNTPDIAVWPRNRAAYGRLCRLLTIGNLRAKKGECHLALTDLLEWREGLEIAVLPGPALADLADPALAQTLAALTGLSDSGPSHPRPSHCQATAIHIGLVCRFDGRDRRRFAELRALSTRTGVPLIALGDTLAHTPDRRPLQHVLTCIREHVTLDEAGYRLTANAERHLKPPAETARLFGGYEDAMAEAGRLFDRLDFSLDELRYEYPEESAGQSATPQAELERLSWLGAAQRYPPQTCPGGIPDKVKKAINYELNLIAELQYAPYFLTVWDIVRFARSRGILCQGRGSAANSTICFCLGITEVDPDRTELLFERFISAERREPPDIDVDFEHARREEVIQYVYDKYGRDRAGIAATIITYRARSAAREVGKAFGLSGDAVSALSANVWGWSSSGLASDDARRAGLDPHDSRIEKVLALTKEISGFPRHLSQHVGGFVITRGRLDEVVPVMNGAMDDRTHIEWDKDDLDALGMLKIDILALGMLTCMKKTLDLLETHYGKQLTLASIPAEDPQVYDMICRADTLGVFQIESRAQMTMLPRLRPRCFYDLVIEVAIVRPGPIQGDMVHPFLRRRQGLETVSYPAPAPEHGPPDELEKVLGRTLGVPLFQEQAMKIAIVAAGFAPAEADRLRRAMATFRRVGTIHTFHQKMVNGMTQRGYDADFADRCFRQIEGFGEYGFPESHAASFALLVYSSCWMKCHYPDVFLTAMLNAQPLGFYAPAQLVRDAREHGVDVHAVDINHSDWDATLESEEYKQSIHKRHHEQEKSIHTTHAVRLGLRQIKGLKEADAERLVAARR
ncbi:MAG: error-prone DNA polymerase, partial [Alphaproteobacteria bacterium]